MQINSVSKFMDVLDLFRSEIFKQKMKVNIDNMIMSRDDLPK